MGMGKSHYSINLVSKATQVLHAYQAYLRGDDFDLLTDAMCYLKHNPDRPQRINMASKSRLGIEPLVVHPQPHLHSPKSPLFPWQVVCVTTKYVSTAGRTWVSGSWETCFIWTAPTHSTSSSPITRPVRSWLGQPPGPGRRRPSPIRVRWRLLVFHLTLAEGGGVLYTEPIH